MMLHYKSNVNIRFEWYTLNQIIHDNNSEFANMEKPKYLWYYSLYSYYIKVPYIYHATFLINWKFKMGEQPF